MDIAYKNFLENHVNNWISENKDKQLFADYKQLKKEETMSDCRKKTIKIASVASKVGFIIGGALLAVALASILSVGWSLLVAPMVVLGTGLLASGVIGVIVNACLGWKTDEDKTKAKLEEISDDIGTQEQLMGKFYQSELYNAFKNRTILHLETEVNIINDRKNTVELIGEYLDSSEQTSI